MSEMALAEAYAACRAIAKREAKNFYYAFRVLPRHKSDAMCAVYAFMRKADDLADDESMPIEARRAAMAAWTAEWRASRGGGSSDAVFVALNDTQRRFGISDELLEQLVAGTTLDLELMPEGVATIVLGGDGEDRTVQIYETFAGLHQYCYLVASVVGLVCIRIFGYSDRQAEQLAVDTGIAFQLTNILRDVKEDLERGRIYISADMFKEFGVQPSRLLALSAGERVGVKELALLSALEKHAQAMYRSGYELIPLLEADSQPAMRVLVRIYHRLLELIAKDPAAIFRGRVSVSTAEKLMILASGAAESASVRVFGSGRG
jgi:phytoene synthase